MKYNIHPDFSKLNYTSPLAPYQLKIAQMVMPLMLNKVKVPETIKVFKYKIPGHEGKQLT